MINMENSQFQSHLNNCIEEQQLLTLRNGIEDESMVNTEDSPNPGELSAISVEQFFPVIYEEASYHELRCISNNEFEENDEFDRTKHIYNNIGHSYSRFCRKYSENGFTNSLENTDDQLFIEIVKEEIDLKADTIEKSSIFDALTFSIDHEDNIAEIKIIEAEKNFPTEQSRYVFFKKPEVTIPQRKSQVVRIVESKPRKPLELANYRNLITEAINSSPEKRMILTDIYKWITENVPFFRDKEVRGKNGWKNCVRHTLSVNERFIRIKNRTNIRSSYWTVCEEGDVSLTLAAYPWASEIFKPEERKRPRFKRKQKKPGVERKIKLNGSSRISLKEETEKPIKKKRGRPPLNRNISENSKTLNSNQQCQVNNTSDTVIKNVTKCQTRLQSHKHENNNNRKKLLKKVNENVAETKKKQSNSKNKSKRKKQPQTVRRSSRKRVARKTWLL